MVSRSKDAARYWAVTGNANSIFLTQRQEFDFDVSVDDVVQRLGADDFFDIQSLAGRSASMSSHE